MHRRAHIEDPASRPQVIQIQLVNSDDNIKNQRDNEEIYTMLVISKRRSEELHT